MSKLFMLATGFFSLVLIGSAAGHIFSPDISTGFIPEFLPATPVHILTAIVEALLGVGLLIPRYRKHAFLGVFVLMIAFLPLHVIDLFRDAPVIGSVSAAVIRVVVQVGLIGLAWWGWKKSEHLRP